MVCSWISWVRRTLSLWANVSFPASAASWTFWGGAYRSKGGKCFIFLNSARKDKEGNLKSNIVPFIPGGSTVSAPRTLIQYVATEYGIANLAGLAPKERAKAMIEIAHPSFREELERYAAETFK